VLAFFFGLAKYYPNYYFGFWVILTPLLLTVTCWFVVEGCFMSCLLLRYGYLGLDPNYYILNQSPGNKLLFIKGVHLACNNWPAVWRLASTRKADVFFSNLPLVYYFWF
jgi:hypothetical protein